MQSSLLLDRHAEDRLRSLDGVPTTVNSADGMVRIQHDLAEGLVSLEADFGHNRTDLITALAFLEDRGWAPDDDLMQDEDYEDGVRVWFVQVADAA